MTGGALLLAAGFSRRFGGDKRRHALPDGRSLLEASAALYAAAFPRLVVVLRPEDHDLAATVQTATRGRDVTIVYCADAAGGMGHSLAAGAREAQAWEYLFVALGDMPWVRADTLALLRREMEAAPAEAVVMPVFEGRPGHPVGFGLTYLPALARLEGDTGARQLVQLAGERVRRIEVADAGVLEDLDRPPAGGA